MIPITDDNIDEADETFTVDGTVTSGNTSNTTASGTVTIIDKGAAPTERVGSGRGSDGEGKATVPVTLGGTSSVDTVIHIITHTGTAGTLDYTTTVITLNITAGG